MRTHRQLEPQALWDIFKVICDTPHPSGFEEKLAEKLTKLAQANGLTARRDQAGNLRIDRPASPGRESAARVILQAHLDMVPQVQKGVDFDFHTQPIPWAVQDGWMRSAAGTTLGSDNGIGVAAAMAMLLDKDYHSGPLAALFTVGEEVGLGGAMEIDPALLEGDYLINLDSEEEGELYIGCAGGARLEAEFDMEYEPLPEGMTGAILEIKGLAGGHSGCNIGDRRGNALKLLAYILVKCPDIRVAKLKGGTLCNVIPREADVWIAADAATVEELRQSLKCCHHELALTFDAPATFAIELRPAPLPERLWSRRLQQRIVGAIETCPNGVVTFDEKWNTVRSSSNLAAIYEADGKVTIRSSQRSFSDQERQELSKRIADHFVADGAKVREENAYPAWSPVEDSKLVETAERTYLALFGLRPQIRVMHAGLECGILGAKNPQLELISFGPTIESPHSPNEQLDVASVGVFYTFLRALVADL